VKLKLEVYGHLCSTRMFTINGKRAESRDFGDQYDANTEEAEEYGCGDMQFFRRESYKEILDKYKITEEEYDKVCDKLSHLLSFGRCGWCV